MTRLAHAALPDAPDADAREQARLELASTAAGAERRNRPTYFLVIGALAVTASVVVLLWTLGSRARAELSLRQERTAAVEFQRDSARLLQLRDAAGDRASPFPVDNNDRIRSRIIEAAIKAGMTGDPVGMTAPASLLPDVQTDPRRAATGDGPPTQRSRFRYSNVRQESLETLIQWLNLAVEEIPGLEVYSIQLKPEASGWVLTSVVFTRWERVAP